MVAVFLQANAIGYAQKLSITAKNAPLEKIFKEIKKQGGYSFFYNIQMIKEAQPVTVSLNNASIEEVLDKCFTGQPLTYVVSNRTVVVKRNDELQKRGKNLFPVPERLFIDIRGKVVDKQGQPLAGASVRVKGSNNATQTDVNGMFRLSGVSAGDVLQITYIGFKAKEVTVGNSTNISIPLEEDVQAISEVVVTALGIKREEKALGYAITKIDSTQLTDAVSGNWIDALSGKVAGLNMIRSNGGPTGSNKIILRGQNNLDERENEALIVVDGVVLNSSSGRRTATGGGDAGLADATGVMPTDFGSSINDINPEDIESVTVLKGPGAAALYGQRGANGAVIITTKSGGAKKKGVKITVTSNGSLESVNRWPDMQYEYGGGLNGEETYTYNTTLGSNTSAAYGPRFNGQSFYQYDPVTGTKGTEPTPWVPYTNSFRDFFNTGKTLTNSISLNGGFKTTSYRLSATHADNSWIIPNTGYDRTNFSLSTNTKITKKLSLAIKANYTNKHSDNLPAMGYGNQSVMYAFIYQLPNADVNWYRNYWVPGQEYMALKDIFTTAPENPYAISYEFINGTNRNGLTGNAQVNYSFTKALSLQLRASLDYAKDNRWQQRPWTASNLPTGAYRTQDIRAKEYTGDFLLKYDKKLSKDFQLTASVGGSMLKNRYNKQELQANGLTIPNIYSFDNATNALISIPDTSRFSINSLYGLFSGSYKNYLYLDITGRQDWSSVLATPYRTDNVGFFYPSASLSFIASEYFKLPKAVDLAKLRFSASQVGSGGTTPYRTAYLYQLAAKNTTPYPDGSLQNPTIIPNPDLKPLKTTTYEVGADLRFFKNRLGADVAWYTGNTKNQILERIVDRSSGYTRQIINAGQIDNKGFEVALNGTPVSTKNFKWTMFMTFSTNKNKIVALSNDKDTTVVLRTGAGGTTIVAKVGGSMGDMYGIGYQRSPDGQVIYDAATGFPLLTTTQVYLGNTIPKYKGSIGSEFKYKQFRLNVLFDGQYGAVGHSYTHARLADLGKLSATLPGRYSGITGNGVVQNPDGSFSPNTTMAMDIRNFYVNMMGIANGEGATYKTDFIKFREASLSYTFKPKWLYDTGLSSLTLGVYGRNLFIWSKWPMFDPEFGTLNGTDIVQGMEVGQLPSTRTYGFNLVIGVN
ncbi:SusC/RagA family TonB-linked outer membrane protein [Pedobacter sp. BS3]|nr:SusC/RagA family TonB-linked outer membrane protein [Pedobacter sp. BS3]